MASRGLACLAPASASLLLPALELVLIPLISPASNPGPASNPRGGGRAGRTQCVAPPHCVTSQSRDVAGLFLCWQLWRMETPCLPRHSFARLNCSQSLPSQGRCWFMLVSVLVQDPREHPSSASAVRHRAPLQLAGKCPLKLAFPGKSWFSQAKTLVGLCIVNVGRFLMSSHGSRGARARGEVPLPTAPRVG